MIAIVAIDLPLSLLLLRCVYFNASFISFVRFYVFWIHDPTQLLILRFTAHISVETKVELPYFNGISIYSLHPIQYNLSTLIT
jgi:hypothetical protein